MILPNGNEIIDNTFGSDFLIAEKIDGISGVKETFDRAFEEWKSDIRYMTALSLALNWAGWRVHKEDEKLGKLYFDLWRKVDKYILDSDYNEETDEIKYKNFNREEIGYYVRATD